MPELISRARYARSLAPVVHLHARYAQDMTDTVCRNVCGTPCGENTHYRDRDGLEGVTCAGCLSGLSADRPPR